eukprot:scaffold206093_cov35-Attheya_sp.AAC.2
MYQAASRQKVCCSYICNVRNWQRECHPSCSRALTIVLKHKSLKDIVAQAGAIAPKEYATAIHHQKQKN